VSHVSKGGGRRTVEITEGFDCPPRDKIVEGKVVLLVLDWREQVVA